MEGICRLEIKPPPPPPASADVNCGNELNRSDSEASSLSTDKCEHVLRRSANVKQEDSTRWTNEKHSLYLQNLEVSFVKQLHQSMGWLAQCSEQSKRDKNMSQMQSIGGPNTYEQYECWRKADYKRSDPLTRVSADSHVSYGLQTCSQQFSASCQDLMQEGTGQNFVDEVVQDKSNSGPRVKRLKRDLAHSSIHDQIVPSKNFHTTDY